MSFRAGFLGLIGQPNAGKSTLLNLLVEEKVSIVTDKPQTTRRRILGFVNQANAQVIVVDAPGVLRSSQGLNQFLQKEAEDVIASSDALCAVLSLDEDKKENLDRILEMVKASRKPWFVVITKVDLTDKLHRLNRLKMEIKEKYPDVQVLEVSSQWREDKTLFRQSFLQVAVEKLPESPAPLYDLELYTPHTMRDMAAEIIREQCFLNLQKEVPYQLTIRIVQFDEKDSSLTRIHAEIITAKENHKPIIIGKGGAVIKKIGMGSRAEIEKIVGHQVFLNLEVVIRPEWFENPRLMKELGYVVVEK